jgi:hypothetical protein
MLKNFRDKITISGVTMLAIGAALLIFTFISAYGFLTQSLSIIASGDLAGTFGQALSPLIATCIRVMYLGVMGWVGSLLTIRGVTIIANVPKMETVAPQKPVISEQKPVPQKAKTEPQKETKPETKPEAKPEAKPSEPEFVVIPPEQVSQPQSETKEPEKNGSAQPSSNH